MFGQKTHLVRTVTRKNQDLVAAQCNLSYAQAYLSETQRGMESLRLENASLIQSLADCGAARVGAVWQSFENAL